MGLIIGAEPSLQIGRFEMVVLAMWGDNDGRMVAKFYHRHTTTVLGFSRRKASMNGGNILYKRVPITKQVGSNPLSG